MFFGEFSLCFSFSFVRCEHVKIQNKNTKHLTDVTSWQKVNCNGKHQRDHESLNRSIRGRGVVFTILLHFILLVSWLVGVFHLFYLPNQVRWQFFFQFCWLPGNVPFNWLIFIAGFVSKRLFSQLIESVARKFREIESEENDERNM